MKLALLAFLFSASCAFAVLENRMLYFPSHSEPDGALKEWRIGADVAGFSNAVANPKRVWLVCHGNAGQASHRSYMASVLPATDAMYVLEYPGYGVRPGAPSMKSINTAAEQAYRELRRLYPDVPLGVIGESLGSGPASYLCSLPSPPDRLVLIVPFDTMLALAKRHVPYLPVSLLLRDRWDNIKALAHYGGPVTIYGAARDEIIPVQHARKLAKAHPSAEYHEMPCGHNDWSNFVKVR